MSLGLTIRRLRQERKLTLNQLAAIIGSDVGNLSRLERDLQGYSQMLIEKLAIAFELSVPELFIENAKDEDATRLGHSLPGLKAVRAATSADGFVAIKKVHLNLQAGVTGFQTEPEGIDGDTISVPAGWLKRKGFHPDRLLALRVRGDSMQTTFHEGDIVIINLDDTKPVDGSVYAINYEGEAVIKRLSRDAGDWWLTSDNPDQRKYHRKICRGDACIVIGRVVRSESEQF